MEWETGVLLHEIRELTAQNNKLLRAIHAAFPKKKEKPRESDEETVDEVEL
jgi:hypothetical protein